MRNILIAAAIVLAVSITGAYFYFSGKEYVVRISESEIQEMMQEALPFTKTYLFIFKITLDNPRVELANGSDRIKAGLDIVLNIQLGKDGIPLSGSADLSGGVLYEPIDGSFYLTNIEVEQLSIQGVPEEYTDRVASVVGAALADYYSTRPAYQLESDDLKQAAALLVLRDVNIENNELIVTLGL